MRVETPKYNRPASVITYDEESKSEILNTSSVFDACYYLSRGAHFKEMRIVKESKTRSHLSIILTGSHLKEHHQERLTQEVNINYNHFTCFYSSLSLMEHSLKRGRREWDKAKKRGAKHNRPVCKYHIEEVIR